MLCAMPQSSIAGSLNSCTHPYCTHVMPLTRSSASDWLGYSQSRGMHRINPAYSLQPDPLVGAPAVDFTPSATAQPKRSSLLDERWGELRPGFHHWVCWVRLGRAAPHDTTAHETRAESSLSKRSRQVCTVLAPKSAPSSVCAICPLGANRPVQISHCAQPCTRARTPQSIRLPPAHSGLASTPCFACFGLRSDLRCLGPSTARLHSGKRGERQ
jgi:hypothetical protein